MNPYRPPQAESVDAPAPKPRAWGRVVWVHLPLFWLLLWLLYDARPLWLAQLGLGEVMIGLLLSFALAVVPMRKLHRRDARPPHWVWDLTYYLTILGALAALVLQQAGFVLALFLPTLILNGLLGFAALWVELRHPVRVYFSGRCVMVENRPD